QLGGFHVVEDAVAGAKDHLPVLHRIPNQSDARCHLLPSFVDRARAIVAELRIAGIEHSWRGIYVLSGPHSLFVEIQIKSVCLFEPVKLLREKRLPPQTVAQRKARL